MKTNNNSELNQNTTSLSGKRNITSLEEANMLFPIEENVKTPKLRNSKNDNARYLFDVMLNMPIDGRVSISFKKLNDYGISPAGIRAQIQVNKNLKGRYKTKIVKDSDGKEFAFEIYCIA